MEFNFEKLEVYQESVEFASQIYRVSRQFPQHELFGISSQLRRAAVSVPANIAEGSSRGKKEFTHFLTIALGSCYECVSLLAITQKQNYINHENLRALTNSLHKIAAKLSALKNSLSN